MLESPISLRGFLWWRFKSRFICFNRFLSIPTKVSKNQFGHLNLDIWRTFESVGNYYSRSSDLQRFHSTKRAYWNKFRGLLQLTDMEFSNICLLTELFKNHILSTLKLRIDCCRVNCLLKRCTVTLYLASRNDLPNRAMCTVFLTKSTRV